jgi:iron complex transport system substrate-binding protein
MTLIQIFARCCLLLACSGLWTPILAAEIVDMAGREVSVPDSLRRVFGSAPPLNVLLHVVAPDVMVGLSFAVPPQGKEYFPARIADLPVLGGVFGMGPQMNGEKVFALKPDLALAWESPFVDGAVVEAAFAKMGLPVVFIKLDSLGDWPSALRFTGKLLGRENRAEAAARYVEEALVRLGKLRSIPAEKRVRVYYAESPDGLATDCNESFHTEAIELAGGYNVYRCTPQSHMGMERVNLEQILLWQPDVILTHDRDFAATVGKEPRWRMVKAVREGRVVVAPRFPHNWIDRPPSMMRALGAQWLANLLYPKDYPFDLEAETRRFYREFFGLELSEAQFQALFR